MSIYIIQVGGVVIKRQKDFRMACRLVCLLLFCAPSSKLGTLWEGDRSFVMCLSVRPSVCPSPSVAPKTAHWILIKFGVNMHEDYGNASSAIHFSLGQRSKSRDTIYYHDPYAFRRKLLDILFDM